MTDVRVHVRLGEVRLDFTGEQSFYEKHVESLVAAAANHGSNSAPAGTDAPKAHADPAPKAPPAAAAASVPAALPAPKPAPAFVPQSGEFGRFLKRIEREATQPDQQVVGIAFYLWLYEKKETFGMAEIEGCFKAVGLPLPEGSEDIMADLTERKRFLEIAGDGRWRLSRKGENYVKTRLLSGVAA